MTIIIVEKYRCPHEDSKGVYKDYKIVKVGDMPHNKFYKFTREEILHTCQGIVKRNYPNCCIKIFRWGGNPSYKDYYKSRDWDSKV